MRIFTLLIICLLCCCECPAQSTNRTPINRGFLQSDLDANGKNITNGIYYGDGSHLTGISGGTNGNSVNAGPGLIAVTNGAITTLSTNGQSTGSGFPLTANANLAGFSMTNGSTVSATNFTGTNISAAAITAVTITGAGGTSLSVSGGATLSLSAGNITTGSSPVNMNGPVAATNALNTISGNGGGLTGLTGANVTGPVPAATSAGTVTLSVGGTVALPAAQITGVIPTNNLAGALVVTNEPRAVNLTNPANLLGGNGAAISNLTGGNVTGTVTNASNAVYLSGPLVSSPLNNPYSYGIKLSPTNSYLTSDTTKVTGGVAYTLSVSNNGYLWTASQPVILQANGWMPNLTFAITNDNNQLWVTDIVDSTHFHAQEYGTYGSFHAYTNVTAIIYPPALWCSDAGGSIVGLVIGADGGVHIVGSYNPGNSASLIMGQKTNIYQMIVNSSGTPRLSFVTQGMEPFCVSHDAQNGSFYILSNSITSVLPITASSFIGVGSALTLLNAANLASGIVPTARLAPGGTNGNVLTYTNGAMALMPPPSASGSGTVTSVTGDGVVTTGTITTSGSFALVPAPANSILVNSTGSTAAPAYSATPAFSGANVTSLNGSSISSGTVADARLSGNAALLNASQTFTGADTFSTPPTMSGANITSSSITDGSLSANVALRSSSQTFSGQNTFSGATNAFVGITASGTARITGAMSSDGGLVGTDGNGNMTNQMTTSAHGFIGGGLKITNGVLNLGVWASDNAGNLYPTNAPATSGASISNLVATNLTGIIPDANLSTNVTLQKETALGFISTTNVIIPINTNTLGYTLTLTTNANLLLTNATTPRSFYIRVIQDATGGRVLTATLANGFKKPGGFTPIITTNAAAEDVLSCVMDGTNCLVTFAQNFQ